MFFGLGTAALALSRAGAAEGLNVIIYIKTENNKQDLT